MRKLNFLLGSGLTDLTEDEEFNLLPDDEWDVDPPDEENDDPEAVLTRLRASLLATGPRGMKLDHHEH